MEMCDCCMGTGKVDPAPVPLSDEERTITAEGIKQWASDAGLIEAEYIADGMRSGYVFREEEIRLVEGALSLIPNVASYIDADRETIIALRERVAGGWRLRGDLE